jgi:hypothetical protein
MAISVRWDDETQKIIRFDFEGSWSLVAFDSAVDYAAELIYAQHNQVDVILNNPGRNLPPNIFEAFKRMIMAMPEDSMTVIVDNNASINTLVRTFQRLYGELGDYIRQASNMGSARMAIRIRRGAQALSTDEFSRINVVSADAVTNVQQAFRSVS